MEPVTILKIVHVLSAITAVGANLTYAFWIGRAGRDRERLPWTIEAIRRLDSRIANPAYIVVLITGIAMVLLGAYSFETGWIAVSIALYVATALMGILAFAPAIRRQLAEAEVDPTSEAYTAAARRSTILGLATTALAVVIVILMVGKPS
ncbi:MAG TPA: DUF2269 family protein [Candidatus Limnocylindrales bacterium]|nr:DUF2269 family protein [Candidatus Limnocylindrales bacterium]